MEKKSRFPAQTRRSAEKNAAGWRDGTRATFMRITSLCADEGLFDPAGIDY